MGETDLILEGIDCATPFPPFSARECTQSLTPLPGGALRRTLQGELVVVGGKTPRKFHSLITCTDHSVPAFEKFWVGTVLKVGCIQSLTQAIPPHTQLVHLERDPVTFHLYDTKGQELSGSSHDGKTLTLEEGFPGGFVTYRPWLIMLVKTYRLETNEWGASIGWTLELEER